MAALPSGSDVMNSTTFPVFEIFPSTRSVSDISDIKMADKPVPLVEKRLLDVKLGQLPNWLATRDFTPNGIIGAFRRGHNRFFKKYIDVKRGGIGGVAMLITGYVVLSYVWEYDHIKHDRWRKYH